MTIPSYLTLWRRVLAHTGGSTRRYAMLVLAGVALFCGAAALCQENGSDPQAPPTAASQLFNDLDDIDWMRNLNPLKLTVDELDGMIKVIGAAQADYNQKVTALGLERVQSMTAEIRDVKQKMLAGGTIPEDFDAQVKKASEEFVLKRAQLDLNYLAKVSSELHEIFTPEQIKATAKMAQEAPANARQFGNATETQWFHLYVKQVILTYSRIVPLLKEMRAARAVGATGNGQ